MGEYADHIKYQLWQEERMGLLQKPAFKNDPELQKLLTLDERSRLNEIDRLKKDQLLQETDLPPRKKTTINGKQVRVDEIPFEPFLMDNLNWERRPRDFEDTCGGCVEDDYSEESFP